MKKFINDICDELGAAAERAMCDWADKASIVYIVNSGKVLVAIDHNDNVDVTVIHNNGKVRKHENIRDAICNNMSDWADIREAFIN